MKRRMLLFAFLFAGVLAIAQNQNTAEEPELYESNA